MIHPRRIRWAGVLAFLVWACFAAPVVVGMVACGERAVEAVVAATKPDAPPPKPSGDTKKDEQALKDAREQHQRDQEKLDADDTRIAALVKIVDADETRDIQRRLAWFSGAAFLAVIACVALWFILPAGAKGYAVWACLGCIGLSGVALVLRALAPYRFVVGWVMVAALVVFLLWKLRKWIVTAKVNAQHGDLTEKAVLGETFADLAPEIAGKVKDRLARIFADAKAQSARVQDSKGVRNLVAAVRGKPKPHKAVP